MEGRSTCRAPHGCGTLLTAHVRCRPFPYNEGIRSETSDCRSLTISQHTESCGADPGSTLQVERLAPFWVPADAAVANDMTLGDHMVVLSGPNMGGKSTFLRALTAVALLANCGLPVPTAPGARVPEVCSSPCCFSSSWIPWHRCVLDTSWGATWKRSVLNQDS